MMENGSVSARIKAARLLRGLSQHELAERLVEAGLPWRLAGALERNETTLRSAHIHALSVALGFPERWFTDPVDDLCPETLPPGVEERYAELARLMNQIIERLEAM